MALLEEETHKRFGYFPSDVSPKSSKKILAACDDCGKVREIPKQGYHALCKSCVQKGNLNRYGKYHSEESRRKMSSARSGVNNPNYGMHLSIETKKKIGDANRGRLRSLEARKKMGAAQKGRHHTKETRRKMALAQIAEKHHNWKGGKIEQVCQICGNIFYIAPSNIKYGRGKYCSPSCRVIAQYKKIKRYCLVCGKEISIRPSKIKKGEGKFCSRTCAGKWKSENLKGKNSPAWRGGISFEPYCSKFDDTFKEYIRNKFGRTCFLCGKAEEENGQKLSVHHVNYDKHCGCAETEADKKADDNECQFIPLCRSCNAKVNGNRDKWEKYFKNKLRNKLNGWYI